MPTRRWAARAKSRSACGATAKAWRSRFRIQAQAFRPNTVRGCLSRISPPSRREAVWVWRLPRGFARSMAGGSSWTPRPRDTERYFAWSCPNPRPPELLANWSCLEGGLPVLDVDLKTNGPAVVPLHQLIAIGPKLGRESLVIDPIRRLAALGARRDECVEHLAKVILIGIGRFRSRRLRLGKTAKRRGLCFGRIRALSKQLFRNAGNPGRIRRKGCLAGTGGGPGSIERVDRWRVRIQASFGRPGSRLVNRRRILSLSGRFSGRAREGTAKCSGQHGAWFVILATKKWDVGADDCNPNQRQPENHDEAQKRQPLVIPERLHERANRDQSDHLIRGRGNCRPQREPQSR